MRKHHQKASEITVGDVFNEGEGLPKAQIISKADSPDNPFRVYFLVRSIDAKFSIYQCRKDCCCNLALCRRIPQSVFRAFLEELNVEREYELTEKEKSEVPVALPVPTEEPKKEEDEVPAKAPMVDLNEIINQDKDESDYTPSAVRREETEPEVRVESGSWKFLPEISFP